MTGFWKGEEEEVVANSLTTDRLGKMAR